MKGTTIISRTVRRLAVLVALAAAAAPTAQADPWQLERAQPMPDAVDRYLLNDRAHSGDSSATSIADAVDRYVANNPLPDALDRHLLNDRVHGGATTNAVDGRETYVGDAVDRYVANHPAPDWLDRFVASRPQSVTDRFVSRDHVERIVGDSPFAPAVQRDPGSGIEWAPFVGGLAIGLGISILVALTLASLRRRRVPVGA